MIVHVNGRPGVGKKTVAIELAKLTDFRLIDNHQILNLALSIADRGTKRYDEAYLELYKSVLCEVKKGLEQGQRFIFTNALTEQVSKHVELYELIRDAAMKAGAEFIPFELVCDFNENAQRLKNPEREPQQKLTDVKLLSKMYEDFSIINRAEDNTITLDITTLTPKQAAKAMQVKIKNRL